MANLIYKNSNVHYKTTGKGKTVTLLHGFLENISMWDDLVPVLAKEHRVICIDLFGHGKTDNMGYTHTMEMQAEMVYAVLNETGTDSTAFIGHSMGGYVALAFAEKYPDKTNGICLMNSTAMADDKEKKISRDRTIKVVKQYPDTFVKLAIPNLFAEYNRDKFKKEIAAITKEAHKTSQQGIIAALEGMKVRKDRTSILNNTPFPKMMIIGRNDPALEYNTLIGQTKNTEVITREFPDGHMSHIENKKELFSALKEFVKQAEQK